MDKVLWPGWETVGLLGRGSFGAVYEIRRRLFDEEEKAALKVISIPQNDSDIEEMRSDGYDSESITRTFRSHLKSIVAEYSLMRKMNGSANVVSCDDVRCVQHEDGYGWDIYIRMELLTPLPRALPPEIPDETAVRLGADLCSALVLCKKYGIIHRDIKPQNIFLSENGDYKLGDFGIAKTVEKTMSGTKIGTYKYMAPEVYNNQPYGPAADIYSLGLVLYWMLNERRMPFLPLPPAKLTAGMDEAARTRRLSGEPLPQPKHGSPELKRIVLKACAYDPDDRYADPQQMRDDLLRLERGETPPEGDSKAKPIQPPPPPIDRRQSSPLIGNLQNARPAGEKQSGNARPTPEQTTRPAGEQPAPEQPVEPKPAPPSGKGKYAAPEPAKKAAPRKQSRLPLIAAVLMLVIGISGWLLFGKLLPDAQLKARYDAAVGFYEGGDYKRAVDAFNALGDYRDSAEYLEAARMEVQYAEAKELFACQYFDAAADAFEALGDYRDSVEQQKAARLEARYAEAANLLTSERYDEAIAAFEALGDYRDSAQQLEAARYAIQVIDLKIKSTYCLGDSLDADSLGLTAVYGSGKECAVTSGFKCSPDVFRKAGTQEVRVNYEGTTKTFAVEVLDFYELEAEVRSVSGDGYNESGRVNWVLYVAARYNGNYVDYAYEHNMPTSFGNVYFPEMWKKAKEGMETEWHYGCSSSAKLKQYHAGGAVALPDDPSFAGQYTATVYFGDVSKTVTFTLVYKGNYETGTGWMITDVHWT